MSRSLAITAVAVAAVLIGIVLGGRVARSQAPAAGPNIDHRYSTQMVGVPGLIAPLVAITDHQDQKLYLYMSEKNTLELRASIDLTKTGQRTIPIQQAPEPSTRPASQDR